MITVYGIPNCDSVKKARTWLSARGLEFRFHDFKKQGVPADRLAAWAQAVGLDALLNRQGTSWRKLDAPAQASASTELGAHGLLIANPSLIKRPVVEWGGPGAQISVGFAEGSWSARFARATETG